MLRLVTPVQYEPLLDGLNQLRPLKLVDESKVVIASPIGCVNQPSKDRPAEGKLLRCNNQGGLLKQPPKDYRLTDVQTIIGLIGVRFKDIVFTQFCYGAFAWVHTLGGLVEYGWATALTHTAIMLFDNNKVTYFPFRGRGFTLYTGNAGAACTIKLQGVY